MELILLRGAYDYLKVKYAMENKEKYVAVAFDDTSVETLNVMSMMNVIQDYLHMYGYRVSEYGKMNTDEDVKGYLYERIED